MNNHKQTSAFSVRILVAAQLLYCLWLSLSAALLAQETSVNSAAQLGDETPVARNAWEETYLRISVSFSAPSLFELLKSMDLESDQAGLASSYAVILKDQIYSYKTRYREDPIYTERILGLLLDKVVQQAEAFNKEKSEIANIIGFSLIPSLPYNSVMGKANHALGRLEADSFSESIVNRLEDVNNIMAINDNSDHTGLYYSALGCLDALTELQTPSAYPVVFQVAHGPFSGIVRNRAMSLLRILEKKFPEEVQEGFAALVKMSLGLDELLLFASRLNNDGLEFKGPEAANINLLLLTHVNGSTWTAALADSSSIKTEILRRVIENVLKNGAEGLVAETSEQLKQSYLNSDNMNVKFSTLKAINKLNSEKYIDFLRDEIEHLNLAERSN